MVWVAYGIVWRATHYPILSLPASSLLLTFLFSEKCLHVHRSLFEAAQEYSGL